MTISQTDASGRYEISLPARDANYKVDVGVTYQGLVTQIQKDVVVPRDESLDFRLGLGASIQGVVVSNTPDLLPSTLVARMTFRGRAQTRIVNGEYVHHPAWNHPDRFTAARRTSCRIDPESGRFAMTGLTPGVYRLYSGDMAFVVTPSVVVDSGESNVLVHVDRSYSFRIEARDAQGNRHDKFSCILAISPSSTPGRTKTIAAVGKDGLLELAIPNPKLTEGKRGMDEYNVRYRVSPHGSSQVFGEVTWRPRDGHCQIKCRSSRTTTGVLLVEAMHTDGQRIESGLIAELARPGVATISKVPLTRIGPFRWKAKMPTSRWFVRIREEGELSYGAGVLREISVVENGDELLSGVVIPLGGTVMLRFGGATAPQTVMASSETYAKQIELSGREYKLTAVPPGSWTFQIPGGKKQTLVVSPGETHWVSL